MLSERFLFFNVKGAVDGTDLLTAILSTAFSEEKCTVLVTLDLMEIKKHKYSILRVK